jgi:hypothetical protein
VADQPAGNLADQKAGIVGSVALVGIPFDDHALIHFGLVTLFVLRGTSWDARRVLGDSRQNSCTGTGFVYIGFGSSVQAVEKIRRTTSPIMEKLHAKEPLPTLVVVEKRPWSPSSSLAVDLR